jgi:hypothetical protein
VVDRRRLERAFDQAEVLEVFDLRAIQDQLVRNPTRPAARKVASVLEEHYVGSTPTESQIEEGFLALCRRFRLPLPEVQQWLLLADGGPPVRADFLWRDSASWSRPTATSSTERHSGYEATRVETSG